MRGSDAAARAKFFGKQLYTRTINLRNGVGETTATYGDNQLRAYAFTNIWDAIAKFFFNFWHSLLNIILLILEILFLFFPDERLFQQDYYLVQLAINALYQLIIFSINQYSRRNIHKLANNSKTRQCKVEKHKFVDMKIKDIKVGEIVSIRENEMIPCDILLLDINDQSSSANITSCFVDTRLYNLGGCSLESKTVCAYTKNLFESRNRDYLKRLDGSFRYSHNEGVLKLTQMPTSHIVNSSSFIYRGSILRGVTEIYGLALFTGSECKYFESYYRSNKKDFVDKLLDKSVGILIILALVHTTMMSMRITINSNQTKEKPWIGSTNEEEQSKVEKYIRNYILILFLCSLFINLFIQAAILTSKLLVLVHFKLNIYFNSAGRYVLIKNVSSLTSLALTDYMAFDTEVLTDNSQSLNICGIPNHIYENINMKGNQFYNNIKNTEQNVPKWRNLFTAVTLCAHSFAMHSINEKNEKHRNDDPNITKTKNQIFVKEDESWLDSCTQLEITSRTTQNSNIIIKFGEETEKQYKLVWNGTNTQKNKQLSNAYILEEKINNPGEEEKSKYIFIGRKLFSEFSVFDRYSEELDRLEWYSDMGTPIIVYYQRILSQKDFKMVKGKLVEASNCYLAEYKNQKMNSILSSLETSISILGYLGYTYPVKEHTANYITDMISAKIKMCLLSCKPPKDVLNVAYMYGLLGDRYEVIYLVNKSSKQLKSELKKNLNYLKVDQQTGEGFDDYSRAYSTSATNSHSMKMNSQTFSRKFSREPTININEPNKYRVRSGSAGSLSVLETETKFDDQPQKILQYKQLKVIIFDHISLSKLLSDYKFETLLLPVIANSSVIIGYDLTQEDKARFIQFIQDSKSKPQIMALGVSLGDLPMMQKADIAISFRPQENSNKIEENEREECHVNSGSSICTRVISDIEISNLSVLLPLIFYEGTISQIIFRKAFKILYFLGLIKGLYLSLTVLLFTSASFQVFLTRNDIFFENMLIILYFIIFFQDLLPIDRFMVMRFPTLYKSFREEVINLHQILRLYFGALPLALIFVILHYYDNSVTYLGKNSDADLLITYDLLYQYLILLSFMIMEIEGFAFRVKNLIGILFFWLVVIFRMWSRESTRESPYEFNFENIFTNVPKIYSIVLIGISFNLTTILIRYIIIYFGQNIYLNVIKMQNKLMLVRLLCMLNDKNIPKSLQYFEANSNLNMKDKGSLQNIMNKWSFDNKLSRYSLKFLKEFMQKEFTKIYLRGKYAWSIRTIGSFICLRYIYSAYMSRYYSLESTTSGFLLSAFIMLIFTLLTFNMKVKRNIHSIAFTWTFVVIVALMVYTIAGMESAPYIMRGYVFILINILEFNIGYFYRGFVLLVVYLIAAALVILEFYKSENKGGSDMSYWSVDGIILICIGFSFISINLLYYFNEKGIKIAFMNIKRAEKADLKSKELIGSLLPIPQFLKPFLEERCSDYIMDHQGDIGIMIVQIANYKHLLTSVNLKKALSIMHLLYTEFDKYCCYFGVQKLFSRGEHYVCCAGFTQIEKLNIEDKIRSIHYTYRIISMAFAIQDFVQSKLKQNIQIELKFGLHSGKFLAAIFGKIKPQFTIFGKALNFAYKLCSGATSRMVHCSVEYYSSLQSFSDMEFFAFKSHKMMGSDKITQTFEIIKGNQYENAFFMIEHYLSNSSTRKMQESSKNLAKLTPRKQESIKYLSRINLKNMAKIDNYKINIDETPKRNFVAKPQNLATLLNNVAKNRSNKEIKGFRDYEFVKYFPEIHVLCILINIGGTIIFMILSEFLIRKENILYRILTLFVPSWIIILFLRKFPNLFRIIFFIFNYAMILQGIIELTRMKKSYYSYTNTLPDAITAFICAIFAIIILSRTFRVEHSFVFVALTIVSIVIYEIFIESTFSYFSLTYFMITFIICFLAKIHKNKFNREQYFVERGLLQNAEKTEKLIENLIPGVALKQLKKKKRVETEIKIAIILYAKLKGVSSYYNTTEQIKITKFLSKFHSEIESITEKNNIFKVHAYLDSILLMGYRGKIQEETREHFKEAKSIAQAALDIQDLVSDMRGEYEIEGLNVRIGIHSGDIVGGIVGTLLAPYDIFGADVCLLTNSLIVRGFGNNINSQILVTQRAVSLILESLGDVDTSMCFTKYTMLLENNLGSQNGWTYILSRGIEEHIEEL